ncbi:MAG: class I SAM-dependent methyltransferase [Candidatus Dadabacteria bacterium]|nr:class I SAM-dependent methyltransferase [Candidatus Dadabacteria bacterium]NIS08984.1 class I SAM-dependent methyltransferase [Candidatus Dadabacteria bacterium]NIV41027.1 methyltransferase domain-containing protein [Candidatus Dadabacteria bacterium]NIX15586.1 methyltransferase domain-containing protein [Candidatus Dadabacteria bacterium]NIY22327.1 methyltransferase domain-containing protein [Candidatus Dadabacteria bacterium]
MRCPLCKSKETSDYYSNKRREFLQCGNCDLVFVPEKYHLSAEEEKKRYDLHENDPQDKGYRNFLNRLAVPLNERLRPKSNGLDFGSGPGPTLSAILEQNGHTVDIYDYFYSDDKKVLQKKFNFITATEVFEHLRAPIETIELIWELLSPGGILGVMTKLVIDREAFCTWHYITDRTHICFFSQMTFKWLADKLKAKIEFIGNDVILLYKS